MGVFDDVATEVLRNEPDKRQQISRELKAAEQEQCYVIQQTSDRAAEGRPRLAALDDMLDTLEERRASLEARLKQAPAEEDFGNKIRKLNAEVSPEPLNWSSIRRSIHPEGGDRQDARSPAGIP